jgi:hypothetical protein
VGLKVALSAPEPGLAVGQADSVIAALLEKRSALAADLAVAVDTVTCLRRRITALSETLKTFGHLEPERDRMPAAVRHKRSKEGGPQRRVDPPGAGEGPRCGGTAQPCGRGAGHPGRMPDGPGRPEAGRRFPAQGPQRDPPAVAARHSGAGRRRGRLECPVESGRLVIRPRAASAAK